MTASTKPTLTTTRERLLIAATWGSAVTSGVVSRVRASSPHSALTAPTATPRSQVTAWPSSSSNTQLVMASGAEDLLEHAQDHRGEQRQGVADPSRAQRRFGPLHLPGVAAGEH